MKNPVSQIVIASAWVLKDWRYLISFLAAIFGTFAFFIFIPVKTIPGNDLNFQLSILSLKDYMQLLLLALLVGLSLVLQVYLFKKGRGAKNKLTSVGGLGVGGVSGIITSVFATASCSLCLTALFGFLGIGTILTLVKYRNYLVTLGIIFILTSIYFSARKINNVCNSCQ